MIGSLNESCRDLKTRLYLTAELNGGNVVVEFNLFVCVGDTGAEKEFEHFNQSNREFQVQVQVQARQKKERKKSTRVELLVLEEVNTLEVLIFINADVLNE